MIPDDVRRTIKHALVAYWDANRWRYENDSMPHVDKAMDWLDNLPQTPEPDWSQAPEWAQWWAVDSNCSAWWYEHEPTIFFVEAAAFWSRTRNTNIGRAGKADLPPGVDWRTTLRRRAD